MGRAAGEAERILEYRHAMVWFGSHRRIAVVEFLGASSTRNGDTEFAVQPETIFCSDGAH